MFPGTAEQRCWFHKIANVLNALPKSAQPGAKAALAEIYNAEDREHAVKAVKAFVDLYGAKWPKAVAKITDDLDVLLAFYDFPAEHWIHLPTTNPIESTFATVRLRQRVTKGPGPSAVRAVHLVHGWAQHHPGRGQRARCCPRRGRAGQPDQDDRLPHHRRRIHRAHRRRVPHWPGA